jgi:hypothetical protein
MKGMLLLNNAKGVRQLRFQGCLGNKTANSERVGELGRVTLANTFGV